MRIEKHKIVTADGTEYIAPYGIVGLDKDGIAASFDPFDLSGTYLDEKIPLRHRVEIAEFMMRAWDQYRSRLTDEMIDRAEKGE